jgi:hypothetical protein
LPFGGKSQEFVEQLSGPAVFFRSQGAASGDVPSASLLSGMPPLC